MIRMFRRQLERQVQPSKEEATPYQVQPSKEEATLYQEHRNLIQQIRTAIPTNESLTRGQRSSIQTLLLIVDNLINIQESNRPDFGNLEIFLEKLLKEAKYLQLNIDPKIESEVLDSRINKSNARKYNNPILFSFALGSILVALWALVSCTPQQPPIILTATPTDRTEQLTVETSTATPENVRQPTRFAIFEVGPTDPKVKVRTSTGEIIEIEGNITLIIENDVVQVKLGNLSREPIGELAENYPILVLFNEQGNATEAHVRLAQQLTLLEGETVPAGESVIVSPTDNKNIARLTYNLDEGEMSGTTSDPSILAVLAEKGDPQRTMSEAEMLKLAVEGYTKDISSQSIAEVQFTTFEIPPILQESRFLIRINFTLTQELPIRVQGQDELLTLPTNTNITFQGTPDRSNLLEVVVNGITYILSPEEEQTAESWSALEGIFRVMADNFGSLGDQQTEGPATSTPTFEPTATATTAAAGTPEPEATLTPDSPQSEDIEITPETPIGYTIVRSFSWNVLDDTNNLIGMHLEPGDTIIRIGTDEYGYIVFTLQRANEPESQTTGPFRVNEKNWNPNMLTQI